MNAGQDWHILEIALRVLRARAFDLPPAETAIARLRENTTGTAAPLEELSRVVIQCVLRQSAQVRNGSAP